MRPCSLRPLRKAGYRRQWEPLILRTRLHHRLYLNWALPADGLVPPPEPLRYERHLVEGDEEYVFASAVFVRLEGLHWPRMPLFRLSYPQLNLRLYVRDGDGAPSVLFRRILVPAWVVPAARWLGRQPATAARMSYPDAAPGVPGPEELRWRVRSGGGLEVAAVPGGPAQQGGPRLGSWAESVAYFRERPRGYTRVGESLRRIALSKESEEEGSVCPVRVEVAEAGLLERELGGGGRVDWARPHSAFLCSSLPVELELVRERESPVAGRVPATG